MKNAPGSIERPTSRVLFNLSPSGPDEFRHGSGVGGALHDRLTQINGVALFSDTMVAYAAAHNAAAKLPVAGAGSAV